MYYYDQFTCFWAVDDGRDERTLWHVTSEFSAFWIWMFDGLGEHCGVELQYKSALQHQQWLSVSFWQT
jgi:hypothetical protein